MNSPLPFRHPATLIGSWFGTGFLPVAPGTWGSAAALPLGWILMATLGRPWVLAAAVLIFAAGWWASETWIRAGGAKDPGAIVADEVAGQLLVLAATPFEILWYVAAFFLFRAFDILKPYPISWLERRFRNGFGVMIDDILAAIFAIIPLIAAALMVGM